MKTKGIVWVLVMVLCLGITAAGFAEGEVLTLLIHPTLYLAAGGDEGIVKEFAAEHGVKVEVVTATDAMSKAMLDFISQGGAYDVINVNGPEFTPDNGLNLLPLDAYIEADPDYDFADFIEGPVKIGQYDGKQVGIPYRMTQLLLYYRTDLFEEAGLVVTDSWDDVYEAAKALTRDMDGDGKPDVYGFAVAGKGEELAHAWLSAYYGMGGEFVTADGHAGFGSEAGIRCAQLFADLYQDGVFPADIFAWGRDDFITAMAQGRIAFAPFIGAYYGRFFDDGKITKDQVGFAPLPDGGANRSNGWFLALNKYSKNPDLAWELLRALTSKENSLREAVEWANGPTRVSTYDAEAYRALWPQAEALKVAANKIVRDPSTSNSTLMFETIAEELTYVMQGTKTAEQGMKDLAGRIDELLGV